MWFKHESQPSGVGATTVPVSELGCHFICSLAFRSRRSPSFGPKALELDLFDGRAWVGMIPFHTERVHPPFLPPLPWISGYPEVNLRTYVRGPEGGRGG